MLPIQLWQEAWLRESLRDFLPCAGWDDSVALTEHGRAAWGLAWGLWGGELDRIGRVQATEKVDD